MNDSQENSNYALEKLRALLRTESIDADGRLPTERALSETLGVSRRAVRRALEVLEAEGRVWRRQGSGTYLGQRPDGWNEHVGSIVAGTNLLEIMEVRLRVEPQLAQLAAMRVKDADVAATGIYQGRRRLTLTYPTLNRARRILWLVTGSDKVGMLVRLREADPSIPAGRVNAERALLLADHAAAG